MAAGIQYNEQKKKIYVPEMLNSKKRDKLLNMVDEILAKKKEENAQRST